MSLSTIIGCASSASASNVLPPSQGAGRPTLLVALIIFFLFALIFFSILVQRCSCTDKSSFTTRRIYCNFSILVYVFYVYSSTPGSVLAGASSAKVKMIHFCSFLFNHSSGGIQSEKIERYPFCTMVLYCSLDSIVSEEQENESILYHIAPRRRFIHVRALAEQ